MGLSSRNKGKRGELDFAHLLLEHGLGAYRGVQYAGGPNSPDVVCKDLESVHFEVKFTQKTEVYKWLDQANRDSAPAGKLPVIAYRKNGKRWVAIVDMEAMIEMLKIREVELLCR